MRASGAGPMDIPPIPPDTPADDVIAALGFDPAAMRAVVVTSDGIVGVALSIPDVPDPPQAFPGELEPEPAPDPPTEEAPHANA